MIRLGLIGTGRIAKRFVSECATVEGVEIAAVYNPHEGRAERFVKGIWRDSYGATENSVTDVPHLVATEDLSKLWQEVDALYIASPHETHFDYIMKALGHGKHVLCEKPMVLSSSHAVQAYRVASENNLVLMEGIKTAYCPGYKRLLELAEGGVIGEVKYIESCFTKLEGKEKRELTDTRYGGSFTELSSYVMLPIIDLFGNSYESIRFTQMRNEYGLDIFTKTDVIYRNRCATAVCGLGIKSEGRLIIAGTKGFIKVSAPWWRTDRIEVHFEDESKTIAYDEEFEGDGLRYEIWEFVRRISSAEPGAEGNMENGEDGTGSPAGREEYDRSRSITLAGIMEQFLSQRR